jgi:hypothetical protein
MPKQNEDINRCHGKLQSDHDAAPGWSTTSSNFRSLNDDLRQPGASSSPSSRSSCINGRRGSFTGVVSPVPLPELPELPLVPLVPLVMDPPSWRTGSVPVLGGWVIGFLLDGHVEALNMSNCLRSKKPPRSH